MHENQLIQRLQQRLPRNFKGLEVGIGDDCSVTRSGTKEMLVTCDTLWEGIHFRKEWGKFSIWGKRAAAAALSDIAAMGGLPRFAWVQLFVPPRFPVGKIDDFYNGLLQWFRPWKVAIAGGNITRSRKGFGATLFIQGERNRGTKMLRSQAKVGDLVYLSGPVGHAGLGLQLLKQADRKKIQGAQQFITAFKNPRPHLELGLWLARNKIANACIDVSDGLLQDLEHIARASKVKIILQTKELPLSKNFVQISKALHKDPIKLSLAGGEDYVLAFTGPSILKKRFHCIGKVIAGQPGVVVFNDIGKKLKINKKGYQHF